ncbi:MAG: hypothetical protein R3C68_19145 [Myxococcota bacterium]
MEYSARDALRWQRIFVVADKYWADKENLMIAGLKPQEQQSVPGRGNEQTSAQTTSLDVIRDADGEVIAASLDGREITVINFRQLEGLRTIVINSSGGAVPEGHLGSCGQTRKQSRHGDGLETTTGIGSPTESMTLRWKA